MLYIKTINSNYRIAKNRYPHHWTAVFLHTGYDAYRNLKPLYILILPLQHWTTPDFVPSTASATDTILRFRYILQFLMDMIPNPV